MPAISACPAMQRRQSPPWRPRRVCRSISRTSSSTATAPKASASSPPRRPASRKRSTAMPTYPPMSARSCSARRSPHRATPWHSIATQGTRIRKMAVHGHRMRRRLRRRAVSLSRQQLRQRAAVGHRPGTVPAREGSLAGVSDHRSSEWRAVHQLPASDPAVDGQGFPRRKARTDSSGRRRAQPARLAGPRILALRDCDHDPRCAGAQPGPRRPGTSGYRRRRRHHGVPE